MKTFFIGLLFLLLVAVVAAVGTGVIVLLSPFLIMLGIALRIVISVIFIIFAIWLLGKLVILIWESLRSKPAKK
jgi:hypothetical protein